MSETKYSVVSVTGKSSRGGSTEAVKTLERFGFDARISQTPDAAEGNLNGKQFALYFEEGDASNKGCFRLVRIEGEKEKLLDMGNIFDLERPTRSIRTTGIFANGAQISLWEIHCLPWTGASQGEIATTKKSEQRPAPLPPARPSPPSPPPPPPARKPIVPTPPRTPPPGIPSRVLEAAFPQKKTLGEISTGSSADTSST